MAEVDNLELLSNSELRARCIQFNLPNVPVTDSSRKLLIRRLRAIMNPQANTKATKKGNRRDTLPAQKASIPSNEFVIPMQVKQQSRNSERHTLNAGFMQPKSQAFAINKPSIDSQDYGNYFKNSFDKNYFNQPHANAVYAPEPRIQNLSMTKPIVMSHLDQQSSNQHGMSYGSQFQRQTSKKPQSLPLPELVNDTREMNAIPQSIISQVNDEQNYTYSSKSPSTYSSSPHTRPYTLYEAQPSRLYPRLDNLIPNDANISLTPSPRLSRSNSLSKSGVVTTSFTQETASLPELGEEEGIEYPEEITEHPKAYKRFSNNYRNPKEFSPRSFSPTLNSTSTSFMANKTSLPKYRDISPHLRSASEFVRYSSAEENGSSDIDISSDDDDITNPRQPANKYLTSNNKFGSYTAAGASPSEMTFREFFDILDRRYHIKPFVVMTLCLVLAAFIYTFFLPSN